MLLQIEISTQWYIYHWAHSIYDDVISLRKTCSYLQMFFPRSTKLSIASSGKKVDPIQKRDGIHLNLNQLYMFVGLHHVYVNLIIALLHEDSNF